MRAFAQYHWSQWVDEEYWRGPFRTNRDFIDDQVTINSYLPLLDRYRSSKIDDVAGHVADVDVSVRGVIVRISDDKVCRFGVVYECLMVFRLQTLQVAVDWAHEGNRFNSNVGELQQYPLDVITPEQRGWRYRKKAEGATSCIPRNQAFGSLTSEQQRILQAEWYVFLLFCPFMLCAFQRESSSSRLLLSSSRVAWCRHHALCAAILSSAAGHRLLQLCVQWLLAAAKTLL